ncbi:MAG TPA: hypothetical protein VFA99_17760 [Acidobacteriaceae bacterium]|nr:hypothetical protein [Acidobacteriaceae bacterium]
MFIATIRNGRMSMAPSTAARFESWKRRMEGKQIAIDEHRPKRSNQQNRFYWFYLGIIEAETGHNANELHEFFKHTFLPRKTAKIYDNVVEYRGSTTELDKTEMSEYMDKICAMTHVPIPNPEDAGFISNYGAY